MAKKKKPFTPVLYYQGEGTKEELEWVCEMVIKGVKVYAQIGKPGCPNPNGCQ